MKFSTTKPELQTALQKLSKATPTRSTLPILNYVLFSVEESETTLITTDLEITIVVKLAVSAEETGSATLPLQTLLDVTNELPEDTRITIEVGDKNKTKIKTEIGAYDISGKPAEEFPAAPQLDNEQEINISAESFSDLIQKTSFAVSRDDLKPALTGVLFRFNKDEITAVATDGHRLVKYLKKNKNDVSYSGDIIVPKKFLKLAANVLPGEKEATVCTGKTHLKMAIGGDTYYTRIIGERFPDFDSVIPKDNEKELVVNRKNLLSAVRRVSIFSNRSTQQIALVLTKEKQQITTEDPEKSSRAKENIEGKYSGEELTIGYNAAYLKDVLSHIPSDQVVVKLNSSISAALFYPEQQEGGSELTTLLMPIRLNE